MRVYGIILAVVLLALLIAVAFIATAHADTQSVTVEQWYQYVCGNDGAVFKFLANWIMWPAFAIVAATWAANSPWVQKNPVLGPLVRIVAGHWAGWLRDAAAQLPKAVVLLAVMVGLAACAGGTVTPQQQLLVDQGACIAQAIANAETAGLNQKGNTVGAAATSGVSTVAGYYCMQLTPPAATGAPTPLSK